MNIREIERKFMVKELPQHLENFDSHEIEQAYLNVDPVIRIRKQDEEYYLTYKGAGLFSREEYNLPLNREAYEHLRQKADGNIISKKRFLIPLAAPQFTDASFSMPLTIELDVFNAPFEPLMIAEVEFTSEEAANSFLPPDWFGEDVTYDPNYHNSNLSRRALSE